MLFPARKKNEFCKEWEDLRILNNLSGKDVFGLSKWCLRSSKVSQSPERDLKQVLKQLDPPVAGEQKKGNGKRSLAHCPDDSPLMLVCMWPNQSHLHRLQLQPKVLQREQTRITDIMGSARTWPRSPRDAEFKHCGSALIFCWLKPWHVAGVKYQYGKKWEERQPLAQARWMHELKTRMIRYIYNKKKKKHSPVWHRKTRAVNTYAHSHGAEERGLCHLCSRGTGTWTKLKLLFCSTMSYKWKRSSLLPTFRSSKFATYDLKTKQRR